MKVATCVKYDNEVGELDLERAMRLRAELKNVEMHDTGATSVFSGIHAKFGKIHLTVPAIGNCLVIAAGVGKFLPYLADTITAPLVAEVEQI